MTDRVFIDECIKSINDYRRIHQAAPLTHNAAVSMIAQRWADHMTRTGTLGHNPNASYNGQPLGENCAYKWYSDRRDITGKEVAAQWYAEVKNYDFKRHSGSNTGHFTQLVWKSSREVGIGRSQSRDGKWFVVANFFPAGNFVGRNAENVFPPRDGKVVIPVMDSKTPTQGDRCQVLARSAATSREVTVPTLFTTAPSFQKTSTGGDTAVIQRREQTKTAGGVTKTVVTEVRRDRGGNVTSTTSETTSHDAVPSRFARVGLTETRGFYTSSSSSSSPTFQRHYHQSPASSALSSRPAAVSAAGRTPSPFSRRAGRMARQDDDEFNSQIVRQHNIYRKQHGNVGDLTLSGDLCKLAQRWAEHLSSIDNLEHSRSTYRDQPLGENIAYKSSSTKEGYAGDAVVKDWYSEVSKVNFKKIEGAMQSQAGHFTQVVWKDSRELGVGRAFSDDEQRVYVVCNYFPAGNIIGRFAENVFPAK